MNYQLITPRIPGENLSLVERVLTNRGIKLEDVQHYLHTNENDILDPELIANIEDGAKMLISHIAQGNDIFIQIDSDCDGFTSAALLINYLYTLFPAFVQEHVIYRLHNGKEHGLIPETIPENIKMVIAPDSSSNDFEVHEKLARDRGIDILVIDHHEAEKISKYACVINNQLCDYPTKSLSGVGMVYKFCSYIDKIMNKDNVKQFVDLAALGILGDMMDLRDFETKEIIEEGLSSLRNPFFLEMVKRQSHVLKDELTPLGVAFYIVPYVNATIRVGSQDEKLLLFESMLDFKGYQQIPSTKRGCKGQMEIRVEQACRNCINIKNRQTKAKDVSLNTIEQIIENQNLLENKILLVQLNPEEIEVERNLTGLIANQLMSKYCHPVLLVTKTENGMWEGSGRNYDKSTFHDFKDFLNESGLVEYAEGHQSAFGVGIKNENIQKFIDYSNEALKDYDFSPVYQVDFIYQADTVKAKEIQSIGSLNSLWGQGVDEPLIAVENVKIRQNDLRLMGIDSSHPTIKITMPNGVCLIKFRSSNDEYEKLYPELGCVTINIVGKCELNIWNGIITPQIIIEDYEIVNKIEYYF